MRFQNNLLMNEVDGAQGGAAPSGYGTTTETPTTTTPTPQAAGDSGNGAKTDPPQQPAGTPNPTPTATPTETDKSKAAEGVSGYGSAAPAEGEKKPDAPPAEEKPLELDLKSLKEEQIADLRATVKELGLSKDQAQKLVDKRESQIKADAETVVKKDQEVKEVHKAWEKELRDDPKFGGTNFDRNVKLVDKLIDEEMPTLKKILTDTKGRVPPGVMRELSAISAKLHGETAFTTGDAAAGKQNAHPTDFYKMKK